MDVDATTNDDIVDVIVIEVPFNGSVLSVPARDYPSSHDVATMTLAYSLSCASGYLGPTCSRDLASSCTPAIDGAKDKTPNDIDETPNDILSVTYAVLSVVLVVGLTSFTILLANFAFMIRVSKMVTKMKKFETDQHQQEEPLDGIGEQISKPIYFKMQ